MHRTRVSRVQIIFLYRILDCIWNSSLSLRSARDDGTVYTPIGISSRKEHLKEKFISCFYCTWDWGLLCWRPFSDIEFKHKSWIELISFSVSVVSCHKFCQLLFVTPLVYHCFLVIVVNFSFFSSIYRCPLVIFSCTVLKLSCIYSLSYKHDLPRLVLLPTGM